jgi:hypothetical protein
MSDQARVRDDYEEIRALAYEYTFALDEGDFAAVAAVLGAGTLRIEARGMADSTIRGAAEIERFYRDQVVVYDGDPRTRHVISNHLVRIDDGGRRATSRCYFTVLQKAPCNPYEIVVGGQYKDTFELVDGRWAFDEKVIRVDYLNEISRHFKISAERSDRRTEEVA